MQHVKQCKQCGQTFTASRSDAMYCSAKCRTDYSKARRGKKPYKKGADQGVDHSPAKHGVFEMILKELKDIKALLLEQRAGGERVLTIEQALKELDISRTTFERLQAEKLLKVYRFGGKEKARGRGRKPYLLYSELIKALKVENGG